MSDFFNESVAERQWRRYLRARDGGHSDFVRKARRCMDFTIGRQWQPEDMARLAQEKRPWLTVNKVLSTILTVLGEQIANRAETSFRPRRGGSEDVAEALGMVFKQISDNNQLNWLRSDVFLDGLITGRGFLDVRIDYADSLQGEVRIARLNPLDVIPDPDAVLEDPDTWGEVFVTRWLSRSQLEALYGAHKVSLLTGRESSALMFGDDSINHHDWRVGGPRDGQTSGEAPDPLSRRWRVIDRQWRDLTRQKFFAVLETGDLRPVPAHLERDDEALGQMAAALGAQVVEKPAQRLRWTVTCDNVVLHDDWSPYQHFTTVPFFPLFLHGHTVGMVENLLSSQELLNKVLSQELHVVNTSANSGWVVQSGALTNMTVAELERKGAQTGLVLEVTDVGAVSKITPNQIPSGLERVSYKAEEHIKAISGVSDSMQGMDREDVAAKAIQAKQRAGATNMVKAMDSLTRTDFWLARHVLSLVQQFYTEPRLVTITRNSVTGEQQRTLVNEVTPEGEIVNNLTLGEYDIVVSSVPQRETLEDSQFEQAVALRQLGVQIPDDVLVQASRLQNKSDILQSLRGEQDSPQAQAQAELAQRMQQAELAKLEGEAQSKQADAQLRMARAQELMQPKAEKGDSELDWAKAQHDAALRERELSLRSDVERRKLDMKAAEIQSNQQLRAEEAAQKLRQERVRAAQAAAARQLEAERASAAQAPRNLDDKG